MNATTPTAPAHDSGGMRLVYWILGAILVILVIVGLITYSGEKKTAEAEQKAQELTQKFEQAGLRVPQDQDIIIRSLGTDGGAVCDNPANALGKAILSDSLVNGASFVGRRPVIADRRIVLGEALILATYCPDKLEKYQDRIDDLKYDNTIEP